MINYKQLFIIISPLIIWLIVVYIFDFNGLYGQDAHEYHRYSKALYNSLNSGADAGSFYWPVGYPVLSSILMFVFSTTLSMQLINLLAFYGTLFYLRRLILMSSEGNDFTAWIAVVVFFGFCPFALRMSLVSMSDMSATFFFIGGFYYMLCYLNKNASSRALVLAVLFISATIQIRYSSAILLFVPLAVLIFSLFQKRKVLLPVAIIISLLILTIPQFIYTSRDSFEHMTNLYGDNWNLLNIFKNHFDTHEGQFRYKIPNILYIFEIFWHPIYFFAGIFVLPFIKKRDFIKTKEKITAASLLLYLIFIAGIPTQNHRFLLPAFPLLLILIYPAVNRLFSFITGRWKAIAFTSVVALQLFLFGKSFYKIYELNQLEKEIASYMQFTSQHKVYSFGMDVAIKTYVTDKEWISLWKKPIATFDSGNLVLFNEEKYSKQWEGRVVMNNWNNLKQNHNLTLLRSFEQNWKLYEIR